METGEVLDLNKVPDMCKVSDVYKVLAAAFRLNLLDALRVQDWTGKTSGALPSGTGKKSRTCPWTHFRSISGLLGNVPRGS
jgi:hypothetical protein